MARHFTGRSSRSTGSFDARSDKNCRGDSGGGLGAGLGEALAKAGPGSHSMQGCSTMLTMVLFTANKPPSFV
jgi:hypothetical protein